MSKKRKRANATGIIAAWEVFWDVMENAAMEVPDSDHHIAMFKGEPRDDDFVVVERALSTQPPDAALRDLEALFADPMELQCMLTSFSEKDSFMRLLLRNECIQTQLLNLLVELLSELAQKASDEAGTIITAATNGRMPSSGLCSLILRHIRWIECVFDPSALTEKLLTSLNTYPMFLQKDIIHILPELVSDNDFQLAVDTLLETISSENELVVPAIEALSNFNMPVEISDEVTSCILGRLTSSSLEDMPGLLRFLVQTTTDVTATSTLHAIREKVSDCIKSSDDTSQHEAFLLQQFVQGMSYRTDLVDQLFKLLGKTSNAAGATLLDVWSLVGFHDLMAGPIKAKAEAIFVKKVAQGAFSRELLFLAMGTHLRGLAPYLNSAVHLTGALLQGPETAAQGTFMFSVLFNELSRARDHSYEVQTQIVSDLVDFAMSSVASTVDSALATLLAISADEPHRLDKFLTLLKHLLDCIERFNVDQCRQVYQLLYRVGGSGDSDLAITVRKQLYHQDNQYRKLGMIGYVCCIEAEIDADALHGVGVDESEANPARDQFDKKMRDRLDIVRDACRKQAKALSFMYAELNHLVNRIDSRRHPHVLAIFDEKFSDVLMNEFLPVFDARVHHNGGYKRPVFNDAFKCDHWALTRMNSPVYLQIMTLVASQDTMERPLYLYSLLNLVVSCYKKSDTLENIGTVLICPILLMEKSAIADVGAMEKDAQDGVFLALWHAVNWCRELLNCFCADPALASKVLTRLENAVEFESILRDAIANAPTSVWLPQGCEVVAGATLSDAKAGKPAEKSAKSDGKGKGKAAQVHHRVAAMRHSFTPLHPRVVGLLPRMKDSIDPRSFHFLLDHFLHMLRKSLAKTTAAPAHWTAAKAAPAKTKASLLVHGGVVDVPPGFAMFDSYLKFHLLNVANNVRWVLDAAEPPDAGTLYALASKYLQCIVAVAKADAVFEQHDQQLVQLMSLQQLILPVDKHVQVQDVGQSAAALNAMTDVLLAFQTVPCMDIDMAVQLVTALVALQRLKTKWNGLHQKAVLFSPPRGPVSPVAALALGYLRRDWLPSGQQGQPTDKIAYKTSDLATFLDAYFEHSPHPLDSVQDVACCGLVNLLENYSSTASNEFFPTLSKKTIGIYVRVSFETVVRATARLDLGDDDRSDPVHVLHYMHQASLLFKLLVGLTRTFQTGMVVAAVLKQGSGFLQNVLRAMPYFATHFVRHSKRILAIFKEVQGGTRRLQTLCAHGKLIQDASAAAQVPKLKKLLERLIYDTSQLARQHNLMDAFSTGILKQRNLDGSAAQVDDGSSDDQGTEAESTEIECNDDEDDEEEKED